MAWRCPRCVQGEHRSRWRSDRARCWTFACFTLPARTRSVAGLPLTYIATFPVSRAYHKLCCARSSNGLDVAHMRPALHSVPKKHIVERLDPDDQQLICRLPSPDSSIWTWNISHTCRTTHSHHVLALSRTPIRPKMKSKRKQNVTLR